MMKCNQEQRGAYKSLRTVSAANHINHDYREELQESAVGTQRVAHGPHLPRLECLHEVDYSRLK